MAEDIGAELYEKVRKEFNRIISEDESIKALLERIKDSKVYKPAYNYSEKIGMALERAISNVVSPEDLPDGKMYYNIANKILTPSLEHNTVLVSDVCDVIQENINASIKVGIKPKRPKVNSDGIDNLVNKIAQYEQYDNAMWLAEQPLTTFTMQVVDEAIRTNAEFLNDSGLESTVTRIAVGNCCNWCKGLAGKFPYDEVSNAGNDIWKRHNNCRCIVEPSFERRMKVKGHAFVSAM